MEGTKEKKVNPKLLLAQEVEGRMTQGDFNTFSQKQNVRVCECVSDNGKLRYNVTVHGFPRTITIVERKAA